MTDCEHCGKPLKAIGTKRSNGRYFSGNSGNDWKERKYHKKCYKELMTFNRFKSIYNI